MSASKNSETALGSRLNDMFKLDNKRKKQLQFRENVSHGTKFVLTILHLNFFLLFLNNFVEKQSFFPFIWAFVQKPGDCAFGFPVLSAQQILKYVGICQVQSLIHNVLNPFYSRIIHIH